MIKKTIQNLRVKTGATKKLKMKAEQMRQAARQDVVEKGYVHFRVKPELYQLLFRLADTKHVPLGVMCREWVAECARQETDRLGINLDNAAGTKSQSLMSLLAMTKRLDKLEGQIRRIKPGN